MIIMLNLLCQSKYQYADTRMKRLTIQNIILFKSFNLILLIWWLSYHGSDIAYQSCFVVFSWSLFAILLWCYQHLKHPNLATTRGKIAGCILVACSTAFRVTTQISYHGSIVCILGPSWKGIMDEHVQDLYWWLKCDPPQSWDILEIKQAFEVPFR